MDLRSASAIQAAPASLLVDRDLRRQIGCGLAERRRIGHPRTGERRAHHRWSGAQGRKDLHMGQVAEAVEDRNQGPADIRHVAGAGDADGEGRNGIERPIGLGCAGALVPVRRPGRVLVERELVRTLCSGIGGREIGKTGHGVLGAPGQESTYCVFDTQ